MELHIGENIKRQRKARSMTQEQLAEALGVTVGAVYKWENSLSMPELQTLVELSDFFEVSVDYLLGYEVRKSGVDAAIERISNLMVERRLEESAREAEKALQKYPNNFELVYESARTYFLMITQDKKASQRCIELFERACLLFDQNVNENVTLAELHKNIAICYIGLEQYDKTIELLKKLNVDGSQNDMIGLVLAQFCQKPEEALPYLCGGFYGSISTILRSVVGYAKAYIQLGKYDDAFGIVCWMLDAAIGLRDTEAISFWDKLDVVLRAMLSDISARRGDKDAAYRYLREARDSARRFDSAPEYRSHIGIKYYHGSMDSVSIDDFGDTAILAIENILERDACEITRGIWEEIKDE